MSHPKSIAAFLRDWERLHDPLDGNELDLESALGPLEEYLQTAREEADLPTRSVC